MSAVTDRSQSAEVVANFDRLSRAYRWMEWLTFGPWLWWCRTTFLPEMSEAQRALTLGDGDGRFTARLLQLNTAVRVDAVDASPAMLLQLQQAAGPNANRVRIILADARNWTNWSPGPPESEIYDLVYTHFFLDCLTTHEARQLALRVATRMAPGGKWVISEFAIPGGGLGRCIARPLVRLLYWAFGALTGLNVQRLPDHHAALRDAGLRMEAQRKWLFGVLVSELWVPQTRLGPSPSPLRSTIQMLQSC